MLNQIDVKQKEQRANETFYSKREPYQVLLVEDDPFWQDLISHSVKAQYGKNVSIRCTRSVHQADNLVFDGHYDLVIFDQMLEGKETGLDLWESLREKQIYVPMIMLSSITQDEFAVATSASTTKPMFLEKRAFRAEHLAKVLDVYTQWPHEKKPVSHHLKKTSARVSLVVLLTMAFALLKFLDRPNFTSDVGSLSKTPAISNQVNVNTERLSGKNTNRIEIESIITPELRRQIARIVQRADEFNRITAQSIAE